MANSPTTPTLIDWLSISGKSKGITIKKYKVVRLNYGSSVFKYIDELYSDNERIATVTSNPYSSVMDPDLFIVKFDNWVLYSDKFYNYFEDVIKEVGLYDYQISRLDVCKDFNFFYRSRCPAKLIKGILSEKYKRLGITKISYWGTNNRELTYDYLGFGRKSSLVAAYLYNKTLEMQQVKYKPWIVHKWKEHKLTSKSPVYRLEFAIKKAKLDFQNTVTGELFEFNIKDIFDQEKLEELYLLLLMKNFRIKFMTGQKNVSRERNLILFKKSDFDKIIWEPVKPLETNRADKIFLKKLDNLYSELREDDVQLFRQIESIKKVFQDKKNLNQFAKFKLKPDTLDRLKHPSYFGADLKSGHMTTQSD